MFNPVKLRPLGLVVGMLLLLGWNISTASTATVDAYTVEKKVDAEGQSVVTVTLSGSGFGVKDRAAPLLWVFGEDVRENGVPVVYPPYSFGEHVGTAGPKIWEHVDPKVVYNEETRYPELEHSYFVGNDGTVRNPLAFGGGSPPYSDSIYLSARIKPVEAWHHYRSVVFENVVGSFDLGPSRYEKGEDISLVSADGAATVGRLIFIDPISGRVTLDTKDNWGKSQLNGARVSGISSGATMTLNTDAGYSYSGGSKYFRMWSGGKPGMYSTLSTNRLIVGYRDDSGTRIAEATDSEGAWDTGYDVPDITSKLDWRLLETFISQKGTSLYTYIDVDNLSRRYLRNIDISEDEKYYDRSPTISQLGLDAAGGADMIDAALNFGEIYFDDSAKRIMLSNQPTYSEAGAELELQFPQEWSEEQVVFELRLGELDINENVFVYVFDEQSMPNEKGYPLCITCKLSAPTPVSLEVK